MRISGTYLNSTIAKRIALIMFLAAFVPTALITALSYNSSQRLVTQHAHDKLVETSRNYGLTTFSRIKFAQKELSLMAESLKANPTETKLTHTLAPQSNVIFNSVSMLTRGGAIMSSSKQGVNATLIGQVVAKIKQSAPHKSVLVTLPHSDLGGLATIYLSFPIQQGANKNGFLLAELKPDFVFGDAADYPTDVNICVYTHMQSALFCSSQDHSRFKGDTLPQNLGGWALFLNAEFQSENWQFVAQRIYADSTTPTGLLLNNDSYIGAALFSLLLVGLLSLIQIRRTMVPLERLVESTQKISHGEFTPVNIKGSSEFSVLAESFNTMSADIKRQLNTLEFLAQIDREIASNLDADRIIQQVIARIDTLLSGNLACVTRLNEVSKKETHCHITTSSSITLASPLMAIPNHEIEMIKAHETGAFMPCETTSTGVHQQLLAALGFSHCWILPICWQGQLVAFLSIASHHPLPTDSPCCDEVNELARRIGIAISAQAREQQLQVQAQYDNLTGLPNRLLLQQRLKLAMEHSQATDSSFWLVFIDLDDFKYINDTLGHRSGDELLTKVADRLKKSIPETDTVARFGGDEFIFILQDTTKDANRMRVLNRMLADLEKPFLINDNEINITFSAGVSVYPCDAISKDALISNADIAMYQAKALGKNNIQFYTREMNEKITNRIRLETHLRKALELNELELHYQPKIDVKTKQMVGVEALIRWRNSEFGQVPPNQFIPLAEESGLIIPIGEWVLRTACAQAVAWRKQGLGDLSMAVNLSARQFGQRNLISTISKIIEETQIDPAHLELELTESMMMHDADYAKQQLKQIKKLGIHLSIDDFGTGHSSLAYLRDLPVDTLKIDKSFIDDIAQHNDEMPIVASIIALAKNLKLHTVAEGVETKAQVQYLERMGCELIQGYYFSKPVSASKIAALMTEHSFHA